MFGDLLAVASFLIMRLGLPIAGILLVSYLLYRWLNESALAQPMPRPAFVPIADSGPRCWDVHKCLPAAKATCPAHQRPHIPCWLAFQIADGHLPSRCVDCDFYKMAAVA